MMKTSTLMRTMVLMVGLGAACLPARAATQLVDDFNRTDSTSVGNGWTESESGAGVSAIRVGSNALQLYYAGTAVAGREFVYRDVSSLYQTTFNSAGTTLEWVFNMRQGRTSPSGYAANTYAAAFILGCTANNPQAGSGNGYAVIIGESGSADTIRLVRFAGGLNADADWTGIIAQSPAAALTDYHSIKVTFNPSNGQWELLTRSDGTSAFADPTTGAALTSRGTATDTTYTGSDLRYLGCFLNHANGTAQASNGAIFDNINVPNLLAAEPGTQATSIQFANVTQSQMDVSWTSGNGANRLVIARAGSAPSGGPVDATTYTADANFAGSGSSLGSGKVVYSGTGNSFTLTGLSASTTYHLQVFEFNGSGTTANYLTSTATGNPNSQATLAPANSTASDIIRAAAFTEPSNIAYGSYQATDITSGNSIELARFTIRDGGGSADGDAASTTLSSISFSIANGANLRRVALYDGSTEIAEVDGGASVSFSSLSGLVAADGGTKDVSVRATFNAAVTDNHQLQFTVTAANADAGGSIFAAADAGGAASDTTSDRNRIEVTATKLVFTSVPTSVNVDENFSASVVARDANDNLDLDSAASVTITKASGNGTLSGGSAQSLSSGALTFSTLQISASGTFTIQAAASGLTSATSGNIVSIGKPLAISGYLPDPNGTDAPYEYVQVIALEDIDFTVTPMSLVWNNNGNATANGWAQGGTLTYKFDLVTGSLTAGQVAYVGGSGKLINGSGSTDISGQTWLRSINNNSTAGDGFGSSGSSLGNGGANADGIAVFMGTNVTDTTVPVDAVFFGTSAGSAVFSGGTDGYVVPSSDLYSGGFLQSGSTILASPASAVFQKLNGVYNTLTRTWSTARTLSTVSSPSAIGDIATGIVLATPASEPTTQASTILFANVGETQMDVSWTSGNGANRVVVAREGSAPSAAPSDAVTYTADADFSGSGTALGGGKVVYNGSGNSFTLTGLSASTTYHLQVFEYNGTGVNANYLGSSASGNPASQITDAPANSSASDIVRASGFTEPANIDYTSYQATDITSGNSIEMARFTIRDGGATTDADALTTALDAISFNVVNGARLRRVALYDGASEIAEIDGGASLSFTSLSGLVAADNGTKNFSVRATFTASVTDNQQLQFTVSGATAVAGGSDFAAADAGAATSDTTGDANRLEVTATKLVFGSFPSTVTINSNFTASVIARDANDNVDADSTASVTIIKATGSGTLTGGDAQALSGGSRSFTTLQIDTTGSFTLQASAAGLTAAASGTITAYPGPTTLAAGDLMLIGYNSSTPESIALLVLRELGPGTEFFISDNEITTAGGSTFTDLNETEASFTVKEGQTIPAGTVLVLPWVSAAVSTTTYDLSSTIGGGIGNNNDDIYVYTAANISANPASAFICGARIGTSTGQRPAGLTANVTWITPPPNGSTDNASRYKIAGATYTATTNAILSAIGDITNNWENAASFTMTDTDWTFSFLTPAAEPTVQASSVNFSDVQSGQMDVIWTSGNGANRIVVCRQGSAPSSGPTDGVDYTADADFSGAGSSLGGGKVVYKGTGNEFTLTGLAPNTAYYLQVYEYNGTASTINYLTSTASGNPNNQTTESDGGSVNSDMARANSYTEEENIDYTLYQGADVTAVNSIELARFVIRDGGGSADADALATTLEAIGFTVANGGQLRRVALYDGSTEIAEVAGGTSISFSSLVGLAAADDGTKEFSVRATFNSSVTDNLQVQFTVNSATASAGGSLFSAGNGGGPSSSTTGDRNRIEVTATKLVFSSIPSSSPVSVNFTAVVQARDANESVDADNTASVTITKTSGSGTLTGGGAQSLVSGSQSWTTLQVDTSGSVILTASGGGLTDATSGSITIANLLEAGDAAFVAFNADGTDNVAVVFFRDVDPSTVLYFNDNEWSGSAFTSGEGSFAWTSPITVVTAGTVVVFNNISSTSLRSATVGTLSGGTAPNLGTDDGLFLFRGADASTPTAFLCAIGNGSVANSFGSLSGTGLTDGDTAIRLTSSTDIGQYKGPRTGYTASGYRTLLNSMSNWDLQDVTGDQGYDGLVPDLPFDATAFGLSSLASQPTTQASGVNFANVLATQMDVAWSSGNGANRLVIARAGSAPSAGPSDGVAYTADASYTGAGSSLGSGKVVYIGSGSGFTLSGLTANTTYYLQVYEYNGSSGTINYLTSTAAGNPNSQITLAQNNSTVSDIVRASGFTEPANIAYTSYQSTDITSGNSIEIARFTLRDGGGSTDDDALGTTLTALGLAINNGANIRRVALYDGSTELAEVAGGTTATFSGLTIAATDGGTKDISVRATFNSTVTDNQQVQVVISSASASVLGSTFATADAGGASSDITGDANRIEVVATKLAFSSVTATVLVNQNFSVTVQARDANNNADLDSTTSVTLTRAAGAGTLTGGAAQSLVGGSATWSTLQIDTAGTFTLQAADGVLTAGISSAISAVPLLSPGDLAIIGRINNGSPDSFALLALASIPAGSVVYFTDNAWSNAAFRGASTTDGDGNENMMKVTFNSTISAGTILRSSDTSDARWTWTTSGTIGSGLSGSFANLGMGAPEQIYAFQTTSATNPLLTPAAHLFVLDDSAGFEDPSSDGSSQGNIPPGLSSNASTALSFPFSGNAVIGLNMELAALQNFATKEDWLAFIGDRNNWTTSATTLPSGGVAFGLTCPGGSAPRIVSPGNRTLTIGSLTTFTVTANDPGCYGVTLVATGFPVNASFTSVGHGTNTVGTFSWNPNNGQDGTYLVRFIATDSSMIESSLTIRVYVRTIGESTNSQGVPVSQTNWVVDISDIPESGGQGNLTWDATPGILYDVYYSDSDPGGSMSWTKDETVLADSTTESTTVPESAKRFYQVVPAGESPSSLGIWGVIKPAIVAGNGAITLMSVPLETDRNLQGDFGAQMAVDLDNGTKIMTTPGGAAPAWTEFTLNNGTWTRTSGSGNYTLNAGQAFFLQNGGGDSEVRVTGPVGNDNSKTVNLVAGYNLIGISEGKILNASTAFESASPVGDPNNDESLSDQIYILNDNGSWRRLIRRSNGTWYDTENPNSSSNTSLQLEPGDAYYYIRRFSGTTLTF